MEITLTSEADIRQRMWAELKRAVHDRHHEWRCLVLASTTADGWPLARTVVLRHADSERAELHVYTDQRSPKVAELTAQPQASLVFWSKRLSWQLRIKALATVHTSGALVDAAWSRVRESAAAGDYLSASAPGASLSEGNAVNAPGSESPLRAQDVAHHLTVLVFEIQEMDWLELSRSGHRRAVMTADSWRWLVP